MRTLTASMLAAQRSLHRLPVVGAAVLDLERGIARIQWERQYTGAEPDSHHGLAFDGSGRMHRLRVQGTTLYRNRVVDPHAVPPAPPPNFGSWSTVTTGCAGPCAIAAHGERVWVFWRTTGNVIGYRHSSNGGVTWSVAGTLASYADVLSMAAAWWVGGTGENVVLFALRANELSAFVWNTSTNSLVSHSIDAFVPPNTHIITNTYGIGASWDSSSVRINIIFAGLRTEPSYNTYNIFRGQLSPWWTFTGLDSLVVVPEDPMVASLLRHEYPACHLPLSPAAHESTRITLVEKFAGINNYDRPLTCHLVRYSSWVDARIIEPRPFVDVSSDFGLQVNSDATHWWMTRPDGVWRAARDPLTPVDLTPDIMEVTLRQHAVASAELASGPGTLVIQLDNRNGQYADLGTGALAAIRPRAEVELRFGYRTPALETVTIGRYWIDSWQYNSMPLRTPGRLGLSTLTLYCIDGWGLANRWTPRYQMRWNHIGTPVNVRGILARILARIGINLDIGPPVSWAFMNYYPDFAMVPGQRGDTLIRRVLALVPDLLVFDGLDAWPKNPNPAEATVYEYGPSPEHRINAGAYGERVTASRTRAIGRDPADDQVIADEIDWSLQELYDLLAVTYDPRLTTHTLAAARAEAMLRTLSLDAVWSEILTATNVGQELLDVVEVTDSRAGIDAERMRVRNILTEFSRRNGRFEQTITLGAP